MLIYVLESCSGNFTNRGNRDEDGCGAECGALRLED